MPSHIKKNIKRQYEEGHPAEPLAAAARSPAAARATNHFQTPEEPWGLVSLNARSGLLEMQQLLHFPVCIIWNSDRTRSNWISPKFTNWQFMLLLPMFQKISLLMQRSETMFSFLQPLWALAPFLLLVCYVPASKVYVFPLLFIKTVNAGGTHLAASIALIFPVPQHHMPPSLDSHWRVWKCQTVLPLNLKGVMLPSFNSWE